MKGLFGRNYTVVLKLLLMMLLASTSTVSAISLPIYVGPFPNDDFKFGQVMARAIVIDPETGQPILVRFNEDGSEAGVVNTGNELASEVGVFSADDYRFFELQLDAYNTQFEQTLANGAELLSREEYESRDFKASDNQTAVVKPVLPEGVNSVYIRAQVRRLPRPESQQSEPDESLILLRFPFDLSQEVDVADASVSIVVNKEGQIIQQSDKRIGYRNGFFGNPNEAQNERDYQVQEDDEVFGPIKFAFVSVDPFAYRGGADTSDKDGKYSFRFYMPLCPIGGFTFTTDVTAQLRYKNNLPTGSPSIPYFVRTPGYSYCFAQLAPAFLAPTLLAIQATSTSFRWQSNLIVDVTFLTGRLAIKNRDGEPVPIGETTYTEFEEEAEDTLQRHYDFNRDGQEDTVIQGKIEQRTDPETNEEFSVFVPGDGDEFDKQGIFFDGSQDDELDFPDLVRVLDQELRSDEEVGILKSISVADVRNTDILVFRDATGQLIMERRGLKEEEPDSEERQAIQYDPDANETGYRVMLRGRYDTALNSGGTNFRRGSYEDWATKNQLTEPFQTRVSDQPRPGEIVTVVAINRATGYMGTAKTKLQISNVFTQGAIDGQRDAADISVRVPKITLQPPNLKIWAEREYNVEKGITQDEERKYLIGSEGASLVSDTLIRVYTEWLDENGYPLPRELGLDEGEEYGLTGRLAKVAGQNTLTGVNGSSDLAEFAIKPGRETQVIRTADNLKQAEHFYIHVIGKSKDQECVNQTSCPSFSQTGEGLYAGRPQLLTPFKVPLFDENTTWLEYRSYRDVLDQFNEENTQITDKPEKPLPSYVWQYRPEYQFSQYQLEVDAINRENQQEDGSTEITSIINAESPSISGGDDLIGVLYSLVSSQFERLSPIDGEQELILALGEEEQVVTIGANQTINFENLEGLSLIDPEDFLTIRLYTNNDAGNILWEYAFEGGDIERLREADNQCNFAFNQNHQAERDDEGRIASFFGSIRHKMLLVYEPEQAKDKVALTLENVILEPDVGVTVRHIDGQWMKSDYQRNLATKKWLLSFELKPSDEQEWYEIYTFLDESNDAKFDNGEPNQLAQYTDGEHLQILAITQEAYNAYNAEINERFAEDVPDSLSGELLFNVFKNEGDQPDDVDTSKTQTLRYTEDNKNFGDTSDFTGKLDNLVQAWSHGAGIAFDRDCNANFTVYRHPIGSTLQTAVVNHSLLEERLRKIPEFPSFKANLQQAVDEERTCPDDPDAYCFVSKHNDIDISYTSVLSSENRDLTAAIGSAKIEVGLEVRAKPGFFYGYNYTIKATGEIFDLYDFNLGQITRTLLGNRDIHTSGAWLQLGYEPLRNRGRIFITEVPFVVEFSD